MSGIFLSCSKGVKDPLEVPEVRCDSKALKSTLTTPLYRCHFCLPLMHFRVMLDANCHLSDVCKHLPSYAVLTAG